MGNKKLEKIKQQYLTDLYQDYRYSVSKFDSQSLFLSSGALGLSLAFIKDIVPIEQAQALCLFYIAIWLFVAVILMGFIAHFRSSNLINRQIELVDRGNFDQIKEDKSIPYINFTIILGLISGIFCLVLFVNINLYNMSDSKKQKAQYLHEITRPNPKGKNVVEKALKPKPLPNALTSNKPAADGNQSKSKTSKNNKK